MRDKVVIKDKYGNYFVFYEDDIKQITNQACEPWEQDGKILKWLYHKDPAKWINILHYLTVVLKDGDTYHFELSKEDATKFIEEYANIKQSTPSTKEHVDGDVPNPEYKDKLFICTLHTSETIDGERVIKYYKPDTRLNECPALRYLDDNGKPVCMAFNSIEIKEKI